MGKYFERVLFAGDEKREQALRESAMMSKPIDTLVYQPSPETQFVLFHLGETRFGVPILQVQRILRLIPITRVPNAPEFLEGVITYEGNAIAVVDLRKRLSFPEIEFFDRALK